MNWLHSFIRTFAAALRMTSIVEHLAPTKQREVALAWVRITPRRD